MDFSQEQRFAMFQEIVELAGDSKDAAWVQKLRHLLVTKPEEHQSSTQIFEGIISRNFQEINALKDTIAHMKVELKSRETEVADKKQEIAHVLDSFQLHLDTIFAEKDKKIQQLQQKNFDNYQSAYNTTKRNNKNKPDTEKGHKKRLYTHSEVTPKQKEYCLNQAWKILRTVCIENEKEDGVLADEKEQEHVLFTDVLPDLL
jgi:hypothetical protein